MALWQSSFADKEQQQCATRLLKSWGDDLCPTCMGELSFDHRCDTNDITIAKHTQTVRDVLRTTPLLDTIRSAHEYQRESTEKPEAINMDPTSSSMLGGRTEVIMNRQVPIQNRNALLQRTKTVTQSKITPKTPEMIQALLRHHPTTNTKTGNDGYNP